MPVVTKLTSQKQKDFVNLYVDDEFYCGLSLNQVASWRLHKGSELTHDQLDRLRSEARVSKAYNLAIRYLGLRIHSSQEVIEYLRRKEFEDVSIVVVERLKREGYLQDENFALRWSAMRQQMLWSPRAIQDELSRKGISKDVIDDCIRGIDTREAIIELIAKKSRNQAIDREKMMRYLVGRGFSYSDIKPCLDDSGSK
jgi:regulatory protein